VSWGTVPMLSAKQNPLPEADRAVLLGVARESIRHGLRESSVLSLRLADYSRTLCREGASFVTLKRYGELRGCIGTLAAMQPLVENVNANAYSAAFRDPRFPPLAGSELAGLDIHISVLGTPEPMNFRSEHDLLRQLRPGEDGLIVEEGSRRGTFLPSVWEQLPQPGEFLRHLKIKAGLPEDYWSQTLRVRRYAVESFSGSVQQLGHR